MLFLLLCVAACSAAVVVSAAQPPINAHTTEDGSATITLNKDRHNGPGAAAHPAPNPIILAWSREEVSCFVHYNMATMVGSQGCDCSQPPPSVDAWKPTALDTDLWISTGVAMGCKHFVYVAKHNCGFLAWNSQSSPSLGYNYSITFTSHPDVDVVASFVESAKKAGVGYGFYYSVVTNAYANVCNGQVNSSPAQPGQISVTQAQYENIVMNHLSELWGEFGPLAEVWFDGGYPSDWTSSLQQLFTKLQPGVVAFQGQGLMPSPVRWVGTEEGYAPDDTWSTCDEDSNGQGDPTSTYWFPAETDFTLQNDDTWFYDASVGVHSDKDLRAMYDASVGHNTNAIIDIAPFPNGTVSEEQVVAAKKLGQYVQSCYVEGVVASVNGTGSKFTLTLPKATAIDRVVIQEDQTQGQFVRKFSVYGTAPSDEGDDDGDANAAPKLLASGQSIGNKRIFVLASAVTVASVQLQITSSIDVPNIRNFSVHACKIDGF